MENISHLLRPIKMLINYSKKLFLKQKIVPYLMRQSMKWNTFEGNFFWNKEASCRFVKIPEFAQRGCVDVFNVLINLTKDSFLDATKWPVYASPPSLLPALVKTLYTFLGTTIGCQHKLVFLNETSESITMGGPGSYLIDLSP